MRGRALGDFLRDLFAGDPVALTFVGVILAIVVVIGLWGFKIMRDKRRQDEERQKRRRMGGSKPL